MAEVERLRSPANSPVWNMLLVPYEAGEDLPRRRGMVRRSDTEGRRVREDGRAVVVVWPLTDFDSYRNDLRTAGTLAWQFWAVRPARWASWAVGEAWDPHGERRHDMSEALRRGGGTGRWRRWWRRGDGCTGTAGALPTTKPWARRCERGDRPGGWRRGRLVLDGA